MVRPNTGYRPTRRYVIGARVPLRRRPGFTPIMVRPSYQRPILRTVRNRRKRKFGLQANGGVMRYR